MAKGLDIKKVVELIEENHSYLRGSRGEKGAGGYSKLAEEWVEVKGMDPESMGEVLSHLSEKAIQAVMGHLTTTGNIRAAQEALINYIGTGVEIGYTSAELQMEGLFDKGEDRGEANGKD